jgi:UNC-50 family
MEPILVDEAKTTTAATMSSEATHARKSRVAAPSGTDPLIAAPRSSGAAPVNYGNLNGSSAASNPVQYLQRLTDIRQMDIQSALDQMKSLLSTRPQVVYKTSYYRKQTKNHWARDDPAFVALQAVFLLIAGIAYSVSFRISVAKAISFLLYSILWNWLGLGVVVASLCREVANRHLTVHQSNSHVRQQVEWLYAFDIHCNAFFPVFVILCKGMRVV